MRNPRTTTLFLTAACVLFGPIGCGSDADPASRGAKKEVKGPNPPFVEPTPKGAMVVKGSEKARYGGTLVLAAPGNPKSFNPILANETSTTEIIHRVVFAGCWDFDNAKQKDRPGLCEKYTRSDDGLTYTFTLREGLRWSDGAPLTSDDFEFTYRVLTDPGVPNSRKDLFRQGKDAKGKARFPLFEKVDQRTFKFSLFQIDVLFHSNLAALYVVPKHIWRETFEAGKFNKAMTLQTPPAKLVSSGPFLIKSFRTDERVVLERNPHFWKVDQKGARLPYVDRVIFVIVPDFNAKLLKFREGETDIHDVRPEEFQILKRKEAQGDYVVVDLGAGFNTSYVMFNLDDRKDKSGKPFVDPIKLKWFVNVAFRKAVSHAIDREGLVRTVLSGRGEPLWCYVSPANKRWYSETVIKYPYDLERAAAILREAGFSFREAKLFDAQDNRVAFSIITNAENATRIAMLNVIKDDLEKLGISVSIRPVPFNDVVTSIRDARNFDAVLLGWATGVPPDPSFFKNVILSSGRSHVWRPEQAVPGTEWEAKMDALLYKNTGTFDYAERKKYSDELFRIFSDKLPQVMLVVGQDAAAARKNIGNFSPSSLRPKTHWNIEQLFFTTPKRR